MSNEKSSNKMIKPTTDPDCGCGCGCMGFSTSKELKQRLKDLRKVNNDNLP